MRGKWQQNPINQHDMLKVIYHTFSIKKVHCRAEEIPIQGFGKPQTARAGGHVGDGDHFFETDDLDRGHDDQDVDVAGEHGGEEDADHD